MWCGDVVLGGACFTLSIPSVRVVEGDDAAGGGSKHAQYCIRIQHGGGGSRRGEGEDGAAAASRDTWQRFSAFETLRDACVAIIAERPGPTASVSLPELPSKLGLWRVFDDDYLSERRARLEELLWHIVRRDELLRAAPVREFVGLVTRR